MSLTKYERLLDELYDLLEAVRTLPTSEQSTIRDAFVTIGEAEDPDETEAAIDSIDEELTVVREAANALNTASEKAAEAHQLLMKLAERAR